MRQQQIQDPQIHQPNNSNQEWCTTGRNRERYDLWRNADEPRNKNYHTPLRSTARREDCKDKDPTKMIELYQNWLGTRGKGGGVSENKCSAMPCALHCHFSHLCFSLAYDYFTIDNVVKQMKWMLLLLYFCPNVKKSFLLKVSSVDSQKMITKYTLVGAWQIQKKNPKYNIVPISSPTLLC